MLNLLIIKLQPVKLLFDKERMIFRYFFTLNINEAHYLIKILLFQRQFQKLFYQCRIFCLTDAPQSCIIKRDKC